MALLIIFTALSSPVSRHKQLFTSPYPPKNYINKVLPFPRNLTILYLSVKSPVCSEMQKLLFILISWSRVRGDAVIIKFDYFIYRDFLLSFVNKFVNRPLVLTTSIYLLLKETMIRILDLLHPRLIQQQFYQTL